MLVHSSKGEKITLSDSPISSGGEGEVRTILSPAHLTKNCVKIYYIKKRSNQLCSKIKFMVDNPPQKLDANGFKMSWPLDVILQNNSFIGFMMPLAFPESQKLTILTSMTLRKTLGSAWHSKYERNNGKYSLVNRLKLMHNITIPIRLLHDTDKYILQDFKPDNVLITCNGKVTICDMDSIQITNGQKVLFLGTAATAGYAPPEFNGSNFNKSKTTALERSWDNFALSVVFYQLLFGLHPYAVTPKNQGDASESNISTNVTNDLFPFGKNASKIKIIPPPHNKFNKLPLNIQELFKRSFSNEMTNRPSAEEWRKNIQEIVSAIPVPVPPSQDNYITCPNGHTYHKSISKCPLCTPKEVPVKPPTINAGEKDGNKKSGCYIATACYGDYECKQVHVFRRYRDEYLRMHLYGRLFIKVYYALSPKIAERLKHKPKINNFIRVSFLDKIYNRLKNKY